jgi:hypothetical protein
VKSPRSGSTAFTSELVWSFGQLFDSTAMVIDRASGVHVAITTRGEGGAVLELLDAHLARSCP